MLEQCCYVEDCRGQNLLFLDDPQETGSNLMPNQIVVFTNSMQLK